jgi:chaperonin GroES
MIKPLGSKILVKKQVTKNTTESGVIIVSKTDDSTLEATVVAVGNGTYNNKCELVPVDVEVGNVVIIRNGAGIAFENDGQNYLLIDEKEIIAVCD